jgi:hypothetical protein
MALARTARDWPLSNTDPGSHALHAGIYLHIIPLQRMNADKVFKALGDPTRRKLLDLLYERNGQTLGEMPLLRKKLTAIVALSVKS